MNELLIKVHKKALLFNSTKYESNTWSSRLLLHQKFFYAQSSQTKMKDMHLQQNNISETLQGGQPIQLKFWPADQNINIPIGGSFMACQTKDSRLYINQYISASPNYWTDLFEVSQVIRSHKIAEFQKHNDFQTLLAQKEISEETGERFSTLVDGLTIIDFCFGNCTNEFLTLYLLYADGACYKMICNFGTGAANIAATRTTSIGSTKVDKIYKVNRKSDTVESLLITFTDGSMDLVHSKGNSFKPGCNLHFGSKRVTHMSSITATDRTVIFMTRQDSIEKMSFIETDDEMTFEASSFERFASDNALPFVTIKAFNNLGKIQCTALSQCGDVCFIEMNSKGQIYSRYSDEIGQLEVDSKHRIKSACISPTGCTLSVLYTKENVFLKSCDLPQSVIKFYPLVRGEEYEQILISIIKSETFNQYLLPSVFDIIIHLKLVSSDLIPIQQLLDETTVDVCTKYILIRALFSNDVCRLTNCIHFLKLNSAREFQSFCEPLFPNFAVGANALLEQQPSPEDLSMKIKQQCNCTHLPLSLLSVECSCCGISYNLFDGEKNPTELRSYYDKPCTFCMTPKPSSRTADNSAKSNMVTLLMIESGNDSAPVPS